jgi:centriolar protein POC1
MKTTAAAKKAENQQRNKNKAGTQADPALTRSFKGHKDAILSTCFNPNLSQVISGSRDKTVMVWNFKPNVRPFRFVGHTGPVNSVAISPSGNTIVSGS